MLITNKQSNILEDLETLKLLSKVVRLTVLILFCACWPGLAHLLPLQRLTVLAPFSIDGGFALGG